MHSAAVTTKGQVTIPQDVRRKLGIRQGSRIEFRVVGEHAELRIVSTPPAVSSEGYGLLKSRKRSLPAEFDTASLLGKKAKNP